MARLDLNLTPINSLRQQLAGLDQQQSRLDSQIADQQAQLATVLRRGESPAAVQAIQVRLQGLQEERQQIVARRQAIRFDVDELANGFLPQQDPALLAEALDGMQPIALFPVRLETRYVQGNSTLRIRVYPDVLHVSQHADAFTPNEQQAGMDYWRARFRGEPDEAERVSRDLALVYGRGRTQWIIRILTPENQDQEGQEGAIPQFPTVAAIEAKAKSTRALLLPDRWCAIGYAAGRQEVFRVWGNRIPDALPMSPDWLAMQDESEGLFDGARRWLVDFDAALQNGMALEVHQQQVVAGFSLAQGTLERLLVVGLEWTKDATQTATEVAALLADHRDSRGLDFVPLGTPTNNTESAASGYSPAQERTPPPSPAENAALPQEKDALELLNQALGLPQGHLQADGILNAHLQEQRIALHMLNVLWRGTFGYYLMELWNPPGGEDQERFIKSSTQYALRHYAVSYLRPAGPLSVLRVGNQPYGLLPIVGKGFVDPGDLAVETGIGKVLGVLRPMWELARANVPLLKDGDVAKAKDILQTAPWSQTAYYRDQDPKMVCYEMSPWGPSKGMLMQTLFGAFGISEYWLASLYCRQFLPDPPYEAGYLAGVPWVLADEKDPKHEAPKATRFRPEQNYLARMADALGQSQTAADALLNQYQAGPALLQALVAYAVNLEKHEAALSYVRGQAAATKILAYTTPVQVHIEPAAETEVSFEIHTPKELAHVVLPRLTGRATLGQYVAQSLSRQPLVMPTGQATMATQHLFETAAKLPPPLRDMGAVQLSLRYLATCTVGELNWAFRTTLDTFSYRLDAWYTARANRRLEQLRQQKPTGLYAGGFGWVENLRPDTRPDSDGYVLAPSIGQAATAAILRSGFMANHEQGAFNIDLNSKRTQRALSLLQGLTRDQPLAALYGYRIERALRDKLLGKLIWPLRLAYPYRLLGDQLNDQPKEAIGARDVVDAVALLEAWQTNATTVRARLKAVQVESNANTHKPFNDLSAAEWQSFEQVLQDALELADAVSDLLIAEGMHQIVQGNFERAGAAMAVVDKQSLPIEPQVAGTPRGGVLYTQRVAVLCPVETDPNWPQDRSSQVEPRLNAWLAHMLGTPQRYRFKANVYRGDVMGEEISVGWGELALSPLSAVLAATSISRPHMAGQTETGLRGKLVQALIQQLADPANVTGLDIQQEGPTPDTLGLGHFEALGTTLRSLLDKMRPLTRKDLVLPQDDIETPLPDEGDYPGVDVVELRSRADTLLADYETLKDTLGNSLSADDVLATLNALEAFLPASAWPPEVQAIDASGADPAQRDERAGVAREAVMTILQAKWDQVQAPLAPLDGQAVLTHGQMAQQAITQIKTLLGREFPVLPCFTLHDYAAEFNASLAEQEALTVQQPWQVTTWMLKLARVREGLDRFAGTLSAHEALVTCSAADDFKLVQYPHRAGQIWAALPEAWQEEVGSPPDLSRVPEELHDYLANQPGVAFKDLNRVKPSLALALHTPGGLDPVGGDTVLAGFMCDEWQEAIPDRFQTAGISFHYDAPGARPPQTILLALPPQMNQAHWHFDEVLDTVHEAFDLARLRAVRPRDLQSGLGTLLPGNYLPQSYTDDLPSVQVLEMARKAYQKVLQGMQISVLPLGKI